MGKDQSGADKPTANRRKLEANPLLCERHRLLGAVQGPRGRFFSLYVIISLHSFPGVV